MLTRAELNKLEELTREASEDAASAVRDCGGNDESLINETLSRGQLETRASAARELHEKVRRIVVGYGR